MGANWAKTQKSTGSILGLVSMYGLYLRDRKSLYPPPVEVEIYPQDLSLYIILDVYYISIKLSLL